ncbi:YraN family protein [candidate division WOR-1 bacterium RIFOXYD2_FULL_36_8]|uniref:UPF0102 protein A2290_01680 n=1 Tax=candidate division WOR-1 bacterium RIFOXYB2_FULL_36_35 TaxID=1802578 RepID=A0A1F4S3L8_UNCSA|nr:MAG: YraN family protein [candidate division WOR-1 bacterium RIFOXYA2_FULL_36_21]OGC15031.1 MAG: YraN family protein [candidate division WOR-1 bacterium RIFOXYB2_FULL_36_35]OGC18743.1 MAG: YraN family protein [candidate division WOR-1 bacterium RIFOXYA12_FULL_36_13]OGC41768.1 MAG: YraN family protein [candidate division WOR-1 bacterium RIFOXYD2_FULL_36_8]
MGQESYNLGKDGEERACNFLQQKEFRIIERNFRSRQGEIDIIAKDQDFLVFVEVKNYSHKSFFTPIYAIRKSKKESIIHAAKLYIYKKKLYNTLCRFDVVAIYRHISGEIIIDHIKNSFGI